MSYRVTNTCNITGSKKLHSLISLGLLPVSNVLSKINKKSHQIFYPTELFYSAKSKIVQLGIILDKKILYPKNYAYTSSTTRSLRDNFKNLHSEILRLFSINKEDLIIDIGSNDGNLLSNFKNKCRILGITPENIGKQAIKKRIPTILDYFTPKLAKKISKKYGKARFITATNVLAHMDNINSVLKSIYFLLDEKGVFVSESHYLISLVDGLQYDSIYHDHLRYYSISSLNYLFKKNGLEIIYVKKIDTHGGSIRVYASKIGKIKIIKNFKKLLDYEKNIFFKKNLFQFKDKVYKSRESFYKLLSKIPNQQIYGISAPSRATTLINFLGLNKDIVKCIVEIEGSKKIGCYLAGTDIPIVNEKILYKQQPKFALLLSWHISKDLIKNLKKRGYNGKFIIPLPIPKIVN